MLSTEKKWTKIRNWDWPKNKSTYGKSYGRYKIHYPASQWWRVEGMTVLHCLIRFIILSLGLTDEG